MDNTTEIAPVGVALTEEQIRAADTETLKKHLATALTLTARSLAYLAAIWEELHVRGEDLSYLRSGLSMYLPEIAAGRLSAELVVKYAGQRMLLVAMSRVSPAEQRRLAESGVVRIVEIDGDGEKQTRDVPLSELGAAEISRVFASSHVRSEIEQYRFQQRLALLPASRGKRKRAARNVTVDEATGLLMVGNSPVKIERVFDALSKHYGFDVEFILNQHRNSREAADSIARQKQ